MRFEDHTDCIVCGGWHRCEFCPEQTPATLRSVLWDYWAAGIIAGRPHEATRECELLERLAMPMLGHYRPADVKPVHHDQLERLLSTSSSMTTSSPRLSPASAHSAVTQDAAVSASWKSHCAAQR